MKLSQLIIKLKEMKDSIKGDPDVIIDWEPEVGWFSVEEVQEVVESDEIMINLKSSNES